VSPAGRPPGDPIEDYLDQLYAGLRTTPRQARRIIAEAEDHLREAAAAGTEAGLSEQEAQEAAISSFGSVRAVVRAHARRRRERGQRLRSFRRCLPALDEPVAARPVLRPGGHAGEQQ
jgi:hypothetical protein